MQIFFKKPAEHLLEVSLDTKINLWINALLNDSKTTREDKVNALQGLYDNSGFRSNGKWTTPYTTQQLEKIIPALGRFLAISYNDNEMSTLCENATTRIFEVYGQGFLRDEKFGQKVLNSYLETILSMPKMSDQSIHMIHTVSSFVNLITESNFNQMVEKLLNQPRLSADSMSILYWIFSIATSRLTEDAVNQMLERIIREFSDETAHSEPTGVSLSTEFSIFSALRQSAPEKIRPETTRFILQTIFEAVQKLDYIPPDLHPLLVEFIDYSYLSAEDAARIYGLLENKKVSWFAQNGISLFLDLLENFPAQNERADLLVQKLANDFGPYQFTDPSAANCSFQIIGRLPQSLRDPSSCNWINVLANKILETDNNHEQSNLMSLYSCLNAKNWTCLNLDASRRIYGLGNDSSFPGRLHRETLEWSEWGLPEGEVAQYNSFMAMYGLTKYERTLNPDANPVESLYNTYHLLQFRLYSQELLQALYENKDHLNGRPVFLSFITLRPGGYPFGDSFSLFPISKFQHMIMEPGSADNISPVLKKVSEHFGGIEGTAPNFMFGMHGSATSMVPIIGPNEQDGLGKWFVETCEKMRNHLIDKKAMNKEDTMLKKREEIDKLLSDWIIQNSTAGEMLEELKPFLIGGTGVLNACSTGAPWVEENLAHFMAKKLECRIFAPDIGSTGIYKVDWESDGTTIKWAYFGGAGTYMADFRPQTITEVEEKTLSQQNEKRTIVYPNPASDYVTINTNKAVGEQAQILIMNPLGQVVWRADNEEFEGPKAFDISNQPNGRYIVVVSYSKDGQIKSERHNLSIIR